MHGRTFAADPLSASTPARRRLSRRARGGTSGGSARDRALTASRRAGLPAGDRAVAFGSGERVVVERVGSLVDDSRDGVSGADSLFAWITASADRPIGEAPSAGFAADGGSSDPVDVVGGRLYLHVAGADVAGNVQYADAVVAMGFGLPVAPDVALEPAANGAVVSITRPDDGWRVAGYQIACKSALGGDLSGEGDDETWAFGGLGDVTHTLADALPGQRAGGASAFAVDGWPCALYVRPVYAAPGADPTVFAHRTVLADGTPPDLIVDRVPAQVDGQTRLSVQASDAQSGLKMLRYRTRGRTGGVLSAWTSVPGFRPDADTRTADSLIVTLDSNPTEIAVEAVSWSGTRTQRVIEATDASAPTFSSDVAPLLGAGTGVRIEVDALADPQTGVDRLEYRFRLGEQAVWSDWTRVPIPDTDGPAAVASAFEVRWLETERIDRLTVRATNGDGLARDTTLDLRLLDFSLPLFQIDQLRVTRGRAEVRVSLSDARDPESGLVAVDVRTRNQRGSGFSQWRTVRLDEPLMQRASAIVTLPVGGADYAQIRMRNGFDLVTEPIAVDLTRILHDRVAPSAPNVSLGYAKSNAQKVSTYPLTLSACADGESGGAVARARLLEDGMAHAWQPVVCSRAETTANLEIPTTTPVTSVEIEVTDAAANVGRSTHPLSASGAPVVFKQRRGFSLDGYRGELMVYVDEIDAPVHQVDVRARVCGQAQTEWVPATYESSFWFGRLLFVAAVPGLNAQADFSDLASLSVRVHSATGTTIQDAVEPMDCASVSSSATDAP